MAASPESVHPNDELPPLQPRGHSWRRRLRKAHLGDPRNYLPLAHRQMRRATDVMHRTVFWGGGPDWIAPHVDREVLSVLGDSHTRVFRYMSHHRLLPRTWIDVVKVRGATALGMRAGSQTAAFEAFNAALRHVPPSRKTLIMLGEVDCGFLIWQLSMTRGTSVDFEFQRSLERYRAYLAQLLVAGRRLAIVSVTPPTVVDYQSWDGLGRVRSTVTATMSERAALTVAYNDEMRGWAAANGCGFLDLDESLLDPGTGLVADTFLANLAWDHHLADEPFAAVLTTLLPTVKWPEATSRLTRR